MATIKRFYDLEGWKKARELNTKIYQLTNNELFKRDFALIGQIRRASISIMANLAEGFGRKGNKEFLQYISISTASACELQSHLFIALDIGYINKEEFEETFKLTDETLRIMNGLSTYIINSELKGVKYKAENK